MYNALLNFLTPSGDTELPTFTIEGVQSGTLPLGDYTVVGDIKVREGTTLTLTAGSIFRMDENVWWWIEGNLNAPGTSGSPIIFQTNTGADHWHGLLWVVQNVTATASVTFNTSTDAISTGFGLNQDWPIYFTTTGTLPAGLNEYQVYWILASNKIAKRQGGSIIDIVDTGSGTHTAHRVNPTDIVGLTRSTDYQTEQVLNYCEFYDANKSVLPSNLTGGSIYRQILRGGAIFTWEYEDMNFNNLSFYRCGCIDRGGAVYIQGLTSTSVPIDFSDWYFEDCEVVDEIAGSFASAHGQAGVTLTNFDFVRSVAPNTVATSFTANAGADTITISNPAGFAIIDDLSIKDLQTSGTLPGGLAANTVYYVVNRSSNTTFQLALTPGGSAIDITDTGTGSHTCVPLEDYYCFDTGLTVSGFTFS